MFVAKAGKAVLAVVVLMLLASAVFADHCLIVYPAGPCIYQYDPAEYVVVGPLDSYYDAAFDRGGVVLVEIGTGAIDESIYQAPGLEGFEASLNFQHGFVFSSTDFTLIVDGFSATPTTYENILLIFDDFVPEECIPAINIDGELLTSMVYPIGDLVVSTPTANGNNYSDTMTFEVDWSGCFGLHIWAFADENNNGTREGGECFTAYAHDLTIPTSEASWGKIKTINQD